MRPPHRGWTNRSCLNPKMRRLAPRDSEFVAITSRNAAINLTVEPSMLPRSRLNRFRYRAWGRGVLAGSTDPTGLSVDGWRRTGPTLVANTLSVRYPVKNPTPQAELLLTTRQMNVERFSLPCPRRSRSGRKGIIERPVGIAFHGGHSRYLFSAYRGQRSRIAVSANLNRCFTTRCA